MALSPLSKSSVASSSFSPRTSATELANPAMRPAPVTADAVKAKGGAGSLQGLFQADGFDGPGAGDPLARLREVVQMMTQLVQMLGAQGGAGAQQGGVPGAEGASKASSAQGGPAAVAPQQEAPVSKAPSVGAPGASKGKNTITLNNDGDKPMTVNFTPNAGEKAIDSVTLKPGESRTVQFPDNWSGNFRSDNGDGKNATLGEVKFDGGFGQTYYDVSYIEGHNAAMTMQAEGGGRLSGTMENLLDSAPDSVKAKGADGAAYGIKKSTTSNVQDPEVVDFFRKHVGADQGYVIPTDDASTLGSNNSNLVVHLKNLA
ncbi:hypothetical protein [Corallococcus exercitus]|uniref:Uncharacterized protein n=1 Tax=Corallococcus exercitus TaxID=2316736 RepID=A0A7Y4NF95_9BACT|nr:hypothetical protein [Corallococcus exercitus]NOK10720.1 hypothetical protein [Corallococcus exercitus]